MSTKQDWVNHSFSQLVNEWDDKACSVRKSIGQSVSQSVSQLVSLSVNQSVNEFIYWSNSQSGCQYFNLSVCQSVWLSISKSVWQSPSFSVICLVSLSMSQSICRNRTRLRLSALFSRISLARWLTGLPNCSLTRSTSCSCSAVPLLPFLRFLVHDCCHINETGFFCLFKH